MVRFIILIALFAVASAELLKIPMKKKLNHVLSTDNIRVERNYLMEKHHNTLQSDDQDQTCVVNMDHSINNRFYAQIPVGSPPQMLNTIFDTSGYIAYVSTSVNCSTCVGYDVDASCTAKIMNKNASTEIMYNDDGYYDTKDEISHITDNMFVDDVFNIGGASVDIEFAVNNISFDNTDMLFGLGLRTPNTYASSPLLPPLYYLLEQQVLPDAQWSLYYDINNDTDFGGHLILGTVDTSVLSNTTLMNYNIHNDAMAFNIDVSVNGMVTANNVTAILESSANFIGVPIKTFFPIIEILDGILDNEGNYFINCDKVNSLPNVLITIAGTDYTLTPQNYILSVSDGLTPCMSAFTYVNSDIIFLGQPFLTAVLTTVNFRAQTIGFAQLNEADLTELAQF